jgi:hypothetical protein
MASTIQTVAGPRLLLPKISQRLTPVRAVSFAAQSNTNRRGEFNTQRSALSTLHERGVHIPRNIRSKLVPTFDQNTGSRNKSVSRLSTNGIRSFSLTAPRARDHHFDTLKFVQRLKDEGFTEEQAAAMMKVLSDVIEERLE